LPQRRQQGDKKAEPFPAGWQFSQCASGVHKIISPDVSHFWLQLSLTPGFSPVEKGADDNSRFNGFPQPVKAAEAAPSSLRLRTPG
jgi:hypothetical protein